MKKILAYVASTLLFNTAIAGLLTVLMPYASFWQNFAYSQCIGFSVLGINVTIAAFVRRGLARLAVLGVSLPVSVAIGIALAFLVTGEGGWHDAHVPTTMTIGLFFGLVGALTFLLSERVEMEVERRRLVEAESERHRMEARLRMLQAQIEPHFLFNTLANVGSLIDGDRLLAKKLLEHLNEWLRVALARARSERTTLGDELDMLDNYLQIMKIRFGERLRWRFEVADDVRHVPFSPMLLQPLVENAVRHGIEPKLGGGEIVVRAIADDGRLRIDVSDSGMGLSGDADTMGGVGLKNVRARLAAMFGGAARLTLTSNPEAGLTATLELPR